MISGDWNRFHGVSRTEPTAAIIPPERKLIFCGEQLEKSKAGDTKFATILMPMVAMIMVSRPSATATLLPTRLTGSIGSVIIWPNRACLPDGSCADREGDMRALSG